MNERAIWLRAAIARSSLRNWCSLCPSGRFSGALRRMRAGIASSISASSEGAPTAFEHRRGFFRVGSDVAGLERFEIENMFGFHRGLEY